MFRVRLIACVCACVLFVPGWAWAKVRVVATIFPVADLVRQVGGEAVDVVTLLPPGASPHTFEPTPAQMREVAQARMFVRVGRGLDDWTDKLLAAGRADLAVVTLTEGLQLLPGGDDGHGHDGHGGHDGHAGHGGDPHVWLDPVLVRDHVVPKIVAQLTAVAPEERERVAAGAAALHAALTALDAEIRAALAPLPHRQYLAFHAAWRYFGARYDLHEVGVVEAFPGKEPSAREIARLVDRARAAKVRAVIIEPQMSPRVAEQVARDCGARTVVADPLGGAGLPGRAQYIDLMRYNVRAFAEALQ